MIDDVARPPPLLDAIMARTTTLGFDMACEVRVGALLHALAASKPGGQVVELGTGTGVGTAWLLDGMSATTGLVSIDNDPAPQAVAREMLGHDERLQLVTGDAADWLRAAAPASVDLVFADAWASKFELLDLSLRLLKPGGIWFGDDLLAQPNWPDGHASRVPALMDALGAAPGYVVVPMCWASGIVLAIRNG